MAERRAIKHGETLWYRHQTVTLEFSPRDESPAIDIRCEMRSFRWLII